MAVSRPYRRKQVVQRPSYARIFQLRVVSRLLFSIFVIAIITSFLVMAILWKSLRLHELDRQTHLVAALIAVALTLLIELLIAIPVVYYVGIRQSHQVVGPLPRIIRILEAIGSGDFSKRLTLRRGDALEDLVKAINQTAEHLEKRYSRSS